MRQFILRGRKCAISKKVSSMSVPLISGKGPIFVNSKECRLIMRIFTMFSIPGRN